MVINLILVMLVIVVVVMNIVMLMVDNKGFVGNDIDICFNK